MKPNPAITRLAARAAAIVSGFQPVQPAPERTKRTGVVKAALKITDANGCHPLALGIRQPYAELILRRFKKLENRPWIMPHATGWFYIHATPSKSSDAYAAGLVTALEEDTPAQAFMMDFPSRKQAQTGGIVGAMHIEKWITAADPEADDPFFIGPYAAVITNVRRLPLYPIKGRLGFFDVNLPQF